jgi:uncharacterized protein involved in response to NO
MTSAGNLASSIPGWTLYQPPNSNILQWIEATYLSGRTNTLSDVKAKCTKYMTAFNTLMQDQVTAEMIQAQKDAFEKAVDSYQTTSEALCAMLNLNDSNSIAGQLSAASTALLSDFEGLKPILGGVRDTIASHWLQRDRYTDKSVASRAADAVHGLRAGIDAADGSGF